MHERTVANLHRSLLYLYSGSHPWSVDRKRDRFRMVVQCERVIELLPAGGEHRVDGNGRTQQVRQLLVPNTTHSARARGDPSSGGETRPATKRGGRLFGLTHMRYSPSGCWLELLHNRVPIALPSRTEADVLLRSSISSYLVQQSFCTNHRTVQPRHTIADTASVT